MAKQIKISEIQEALEKGMKRAEIQSHFELTGSEMKLIFSHPKLKGIRAKRSHVDIIDDTIVEEQIPFSVNQQFLFEGAESENATL